MQSVSTLISAIPPVRLLQQDALVKLRLCCVSIIVSLFEKLQMSKWVYELCRRFGDDAAHPLQGQHCIPSETWSPIQLYVEDQDNRSVVLYICIYVMVYKQIVVFLGSEQWTLRITVQFPFSLFNFPRWRYSWRIFGGYRLLFGKSHY